MCYFFGPWAVIFLNLNNIMWTDSVTETGGAMEVVDARRTWPRLGLTKQETRERQILREGKGHTSMNCQWWWHRTQWMLAVAMDVLDRFGVMEERETKRGTKIDVAEV